MWWKKESPPEKSRLEELIQARDDLRRQIQILKDGPVYYRDRTPQTARLVKDLSAALYEIEQELVEEQSDNPKGTT